MSFLIKKLINANGAIYNNSEFCDCYLEYTFVNNCGLVKIVEMTPPLLLSNGQFIVEEVILER